MSDSLTVLIASYLEPEHVDRIRAEFPQLNVIYRPDLIGKPRFAADHTSRIERTPEQEAEWRGLLAQADVLYDFDFTNLDELPELAPNVKWVQASSSGIGQLVKRLGYADRTDWIFTTASGVHARPLAEFAIMAMIYFAKDVPHLMREKQARHWERYSVSDLAGKTLAVIGLGKIGRETARLAKAFDMRVIGTRRDVTKAVEHVDELFAPDDLDAVLPQADYLVLATPHTPETEGMIDARRVGLLKRGAVIVNVARGVVIDQAAMTAALQDGRLTGAALDVFEVEPLPQDDPLWGMDNVLISPHSASTADSENGKLTALFCDNMRRYLNDEPLRNVLDTEKLY